MQTAGRAPRIIRLPPRITPSLRIVTRLSSAVPAVEARVKCVSIATAGILAGSRFIAKAPGLSHRLSRPACARARTSGARPTASVRGRSQSDGESRERGDVEAAPTGSRDTRAPAELRYRSI